MEMTGRMYFSFPPALKSRIVSGTNMISETSFVTSMEVKNTPKIRNADSPAMLLKPEASFISGLNIFSFLKPSRTQSIINSVPSVLQSISLRRVFDGGVMIRETAAAITAATSIGSFFKNDDIFFMEYD